jgi:hypothetical protein
VCKKKGDILVLIKVIRAAGNGNEVNVVRIDGDEEGRRRWRVFDQ